MANTIVVAYDGTPHSRDALALARSWSELTGASLAAANVHRSGPRGRAPSTAAAGREAFLRRESERLLEQASDLGGDEVQRFAVGGTTTASGLRGLARADEGDLLVFGSAHAQPPGRVHPGSAARRLLHGGGSAIALAPAGWSERPQLGLSTVAVAEDDEDGSARQTAEHFASVGATRIVRWPDERADLLVLGSHRSTPVGKVMTSARAEQLIQSSTSPVVVLPHGVALASAAPLAHAA